jgi:hypothetical protein
VLEHLVGTIQFLGQQCLAFRGSSDVLREDNGHYVKLAKLFADIDSVTAEHYRSVRGKDTFIV